MALEVVCEQRTFTLDHRDLVIDGSVEGDVTVIASDRTDIEVVASIMSIAPTEAEARQLVDATRIQTQGVVRAVPSDRSAGPDNRSLSTGFEIHVPRTTNLDLTTRNGGVSILGVSGEIAVQTSSGGISLRDLSGHVRAKTENGGIVASLVGERWNGRGLDMASSSGRISISVSETYSADIEATSQWGRISLDGVDIGEPTVWREGRGETISGRFRQGGAPIKAMTVHGVVAIQRSR